MGSVDTDNNVLQALASTLASSDNLSAEGYPGRHDSRITTRSVLTFIDWYLCLWRIVSVGELWVQ